jgi:GNAT superfamily N-acetyltransferase
MRGFPEIRKLRPGDVDEVVAAFEAIGWRKPASQYVRYLDEQECGTRAVWVAFVDAAFAGYLTVNWSPAYPPFRDASIPEIQDLNVLPRNRRCGIATALLDRAERAIAERSGRAGIGVGMDGDYGAAQRLYVRRGYVPDGRGLTYRNRALRHGDETRVDDDLVLYLTREMTA